MLRIIKTERLILRPFEENDAETALGWFGDPRVMRFVPSGPDKSLDEVRRRIALYRQHQATHGFSKWIILERASGEAIGDTGLIVLEHEGWIDLGFRLKPKYWDQGLATEAGSAWVKTAFRDLGLQSLGAFTHPDNAASIKVLRKLGFSSLRKDTIMGMPAIVFELRNKIETTRLENVPQHLPLIARWLYDEWGHALPDGSPARAERLLRTAPDERGLPVSLVALWDGAPAGIARLVASDLETRPDLGPWLASVFVPITYRGRGIGTHLCARIIAEARRLGFASLYLFTPDRQSFYARQGWDVLERTVYREKQVVIMHHMLGE